MLKKLIFSLCFWMILFGSVNAQENASHPDENHSSVSHEGGDDHGAHAVFNPAKTAIHHISDGNVLTILEIVSIPLPTILYQKGKGLDIFSSGKFHADPHHHENGHSSYNGYVLFEGSVCNVLDPSFPQEGTVEVDGFISKEEPNAAGEIKDVVYVQYKGHEYKVDSRSTLDGGILGGGITSFYDLSITKNVLSLFIVSLFLFWLFRKAVKRYNTHPSEAPKGLQGLLEPMVIFIRDEVAIPFIGEKKYQKYISLLMSLFFFVLGSNLFGQVPFFGSINATGNITITMILAVIVFIIVNINGNKNYWKHIFWMPGVPTAVKPLLALIEIASLFIKPLTLMLRLAGNISAGHIAILSFIGLIFVFGASGTNMLGAGVGTVLAVPLTMFMMAIELLVAFLQAYVFTLLAASYIGAATEEHH